MYVSDLLLVLVPLAGCLAPHLGEQLQVRAVNHLLRHVAHLNIIVSIISTVYIYCSAEDNDSAK